MVWRGMGVVGISGYVRWVFGGFELGGFEEFWKGRGWC